MAAPLVFTGALGGALAFGDKKWLDKANDALVRGLGLLLWDWCTSVVQNDV